ncbi:MAG: trypsin-like peptidase domain-containing protein [Kordiimonadaceae bacterium]|nr:trypsin-like peptidase domain-containing protein [Kordiimonadaceae bacterium]
MRRKLEYGAYAVLILYFILKYSTVDLEAPRRVAPERQDPPAIMLPDDAALPSNDHAIVQVELEHKATNTVGTAFAIDSIGTYVTARHVVDGCKQVYFLVDGRRPEQVRSFKSESNRDFAIIKANRSLVKYVGLSTDRPQRGTEGYMMGYPQGEPADVRATVIGRTQMKSSGRYRMREPVVAWVERERRPGSSGSLGGISGGPVLDSEGYVIGTVVAGAPRRGRIYTTDPKVFIEAGLTEGTSRIYPIFFDEGISKDNYAIWGKKLRASNTIAQVYCQAK